MRSHSVLKLPRTLAPKTWESMVRQSVVDAYQSTSSALSLDPSAGVITEGIRDVMTSDTCKRN